jgi:hypothetical protein
MEKSDPTKAPEFQKVLRHFVTTPHKPHKPHKPKASAKPTSAVERLAAIIRTSALLAFDNDCSCLLCFPATYLGGQPSEGLHIASLPCRRSEAGELIRAYFDVNDGVTPVDIFFSPLRALIEPSIVGVGNVVLHERAEGFVISLYDGCDIDIIAHSDSSLSCAV